VADPLPDAAALARALAELAAAEVPPAPELAAALARDVDRLLEAHQDVVYAVCVRAVGSPEQARELAQDTLLLAYRKLPTFRGEARFRTWLISIARYLCLNARRRHRELLLEDGVFEPTDPGADALRHLRRAERDALLAEAAAAALDADEQEAIHLRYVEHLPLETITAVLGLENKSGARGLLQRCQRKLRAELARRLDALGHGPSLLVGSSS
jgi:RNA polymerase sigma-70 factor (ECF subfamily)